VAVLGSETKGNVNLVAGLQRLGFEAALVPPREARSLAWAEGVAIAIARPDVLPTLDGVEDGLLELLWLERSGRIRVVNSVRALLAAHDKLRTSRLLEAAGLPQPRTAHVRSPEALRRVEPPVVVKPRFGAWGRDVFRCRHRAELDRCAGEVLGRSWFRRHGAIVQELLPSTGSDLRLIVAAGEAVGAVERSAAPGEWRTNVSLGGTFRAVTPPVTASALGCAAAAALGAELVGVDLFPTPGGEWVVLELNGSVDFDATYSLAGRDVYADIASVLELAAPVRTLPAAAAGRREDAGSHGRWGEL
jgi:RimK family alpha-L-glutamate ligase